jgi:hypothetical protein
VAFEALFVKLALQTNKKKSEFEEPDSECSNLALISKL